MFSANFRLNPYRKQYPNYYHGRIFKKNGSLIHCSSKSRKFKILVKGTEKAAEKTILYSYALYRQYTQQNGLRVKNNQTLSIH